MDKKNKIFWLTIGSLMLFSIFAAYLRIYVFMDYQIETEIACDPKIESCFTYVCNPQIEECSGIPEEDTSYYKILNKKAANFSLCNSQDPLCAKENECRENEADCEIVYCDSQIDENCFGLSEPMEL